MCELWISNDVSSSPLLIQDMLNQERCQGPNPAARSRDVDVPVIQDRAVLIDFPIRTDRSSHQISSVQESQAGQFNLESMLNSEAGVTQASKSFEHLLADFINVMKEADAPPMTAEMCRTWFADPKLYKGFQMVGLCFKGQNQMTFNCT